MAADWIDFGERIINALSTLRISEIIIPVDDELRQSIGTTEALQKMQTPSFWNIRRPGGTPAFDGWVRQGIEVVPKFDVSGNVWGVGFRLIAAMNLDEAVAAEGDDDA